MTIVLLALELLLLTAGALGLHAVSRRYGLAPLLLYLAGLVALLHALGAMPVMVEAWAGVHIVTVDVTLVPVILVVFLVLYDANGAAAGRAAILGVFGITVVSLVVQVSQFTHIRLGGRVASSSAAAVLAPNWQFTAASIVAFLVGMMTVVAVYQGARNRARWLPGWSVRVLALVAAAAADTITFQGLAFVDAAPLAGLLSALAAKCAAALFVSPFTVWYLLRVAPRLPAYVGPEDRRTFDILFGTYGRQQADLRATQVEGRRAEARVREADARFRHTFESAAVGIVHMAPDGTILMANPSMAGFLGYQVGELQDRNLRSLMLDDGSGATAHEGLVPLLRAAERRFVRKNGTAAWGYTNTTEIRDDEGRASYHIVVVEDVTARKAAEERLRGVERLEAVGQLTGGVAHDFNNLLAIIVGDIECAAQQLESGEDPSESLASVLYAARRGAKLTQQLLAYSRQQVLRPEPLDPERLLGEMSGLLHLAVGGGIEVVVSAEPGLRIFADRGLLESALLSLVANAREAMPRGGRLTIRALHVLPGALAAAEDGEPTPGSYVTIEVADTGTGMTPEVASHSFEPFVTTKEPGRGSGLGLSMVYGFAMQSGGHVTLESAPGRGTTVRLSLPAAQDKRPADGEAPAVSDTSGSGELILVVEDDQEVARVLSNTLASLGYRTSTAPDAPHAAEQMLQARPSLVIMDVMLPGSMSGADLAEDIGRGYPGVPVLFVSGYSRDVLQSRRRLPAGADVLMKPFGRAEIGQRIRSLLESAAG